MSNEYWDKFLAIMGDGNYRILIMSSGDDWARTVPAEPGRFEKSPRVAKNSGRCRVSFAVGELVVYVDDGPDPEQAALGIGIWEKPVRAGRVYTIREINLPRNIPPHELNCVRLKEVIRKTRRGDTPLRASTASARCLKPT